MTLERFKCPVATVSADDTVERAARIMEERHVGSLVVTRDGHPIGIVTDRDLVLRVVAAGFDPKTSRVHDHVTYDPITLSVEDGVETAIERMRRHGVRRLPIVGSGGRVVGIVTADDLLALLGRQIGALCEAIEEPSDSTDSA